MVPIVETERLRLRGHALDDFEMECTIWADPIVTRFIGKKPSTRSEAWYRLLRYVGHWQLLGYGYWVITDKVSGAFLGEVGFADYKRELTPALDAPEIGWGLMPSAHGKGIGTEAVRAATAWADQRWERTVCIIDPDNLASLRVAEKCGYREYARASLGGDPTILHERLR
jgi:RimJ/RimL family protein N-acetyltransferase